MKNTLKLKAFKRIKASRKDQNVKQYRKTRCRQPLDQYSKDDVKNIIFTDEKDFTSEIALNHQNDRVHGTENRKIPYHLQYYTTNIHPFQRN